jgi:hypothetical protein
MSSSKGKSLESEYIKQLFGMVMYIVLLVMKVMLECFTGSEDANNEEFTENESKLEVDMPTKCTKCGVMQNKNVE